MKKDADGFNARAEELLERYAGLVYRLAFARTRRRDAADDIFQEVFLRLVAKRPQLENEEHEKAWFCRVTINCANSYWRNPFRRRTQPLEDTGELTAPLTWRMPSPPGSAWRPAILFPVIGRLGWP